MSKAIDALRKEHDAILSALKILSAITSRMDHGLDVEKKGIRDFIGFLKDFADKCHHGKEEGILFPELVKAGIPQKGSPIEVMMAEHAEGRTLIKQMEEASSGNLDRPKFIVAAKEYETLLQSHIEKENGVLFPTAETTLGEQRLDQLSDLFEQHEVKVMGSGRHEELHTMLKSLKQKYFV